MEKALKEIAEILKEAAAEDTVENDEKKAADAKAVEMKTELWKVWAEHRKKEAQ